MFFTHLNLSQRERDLKVTQDLITIFEEQNKQDV